ncbi:centrosomal protein of 85 kDa isoform X2 [Ambystoma mexicanum]|uniref:centrosomal protein of 85 kDa isoform X2 n=1 Tax=Ambystoma mexicanum TaxID=8296 RepID=UPI0037E97B5B
MEALNRHQDFRQQQTSRTGSNNGVNVSSDTNWQTPILSAKFKTRFAYEHGMMGSGNPAFRADCTEDFITANGTSSFQPIKSHVTIPTAHVMPSTQGSPIGIAHLQGVRSPVCTSAGLLEHGQPRAITDTTQGAAPAVSSDTLSADALSAVKLGDYGFENSLSPWGDHGRDDIRRFDVPNIEPTLNQSSLLDTLSNEARLRMQIYNHGAVTAEKDRETYQSLPTSKSPLNSAVDGSSLTTKAKPMPMGFQQNIYCKPMAPQTQLWRQESHSMQPDIAGERAAWQKQLANMRVQMEQLQGLNGAGCPQQSAYGMAVHHAVEPSHWENLLKSSETLLKDKDFLVERQRQHIAQLEQKMRESELQVHSALMGRPAPYGDVYMLRLQELQRENTFLRAQFAEQYEAFRKEKAVLEQKLAALETNGKTSQETLQASTQKHEQEMKKQEERVKGRDKHINNLKKKCQKESEQNREKQQRIETLERYLAGLPTQEDHQKQSQQLKDMDEKCANLKEKVIELERSLGKTRNACREGEAQLETEKQKGMELLITVQSLQKKLDVCLKNGEGEEPPHVNEELEKECEALKKEQEYLKKMVNSQKRKIEQLSLQLKSMKDQAAQEEGAEQALCEESRRKEEAVQQLREAVKENQDLMERNLLLQEQLGQQKDRESTPQDQAAKLLAQLYRDLFWCLQDLQSVCSTITQRSQGKDPNLSLLLGIHSVPPDMEDSENVQSPEVLARKLSEVKQLHKDIVELRTAISDRYASDMGDNCVTQ